MPSRSGSPPFALSLAITNAWVSQLFDQELEKRGVAPFQTGTLLMLHRLQPVTPSDLQAAMGVPATTLRNRLNELVAAGLVERVPHPQDGRSHLLRTTTAAHDVVRTCKTAARAAQRLLASAGVDVDALAAELEPLRNTAISLVADDRQPTRASLTTGPW